MTMLSLSQLALYGLTLAFPLAILFHFRLTAEKKPPAKAAAAPAPQGEKDEKEKEKSSSIMQPERTDIAPPKDDPFTQEELKAYDGKDASKPVYVAIKGTFVRSTNQLTTPLFRYPRSGVYAYTCIGTVFDVSRKRETYGPGGSYAILAGKDGSRALGLSSLKPEDAVADWSTLEEKDRKTLDDWHSFFTCVSFKAFVIFGY
jgi:membrane-associated progesterone receptor component